MGDIQGGDVLIFRMELLEILKGHKKVKKRVCSPEAADDCEPYLLELIDEFSEKSCADIVGKIKSMKQTAKYSPPLNAREKEEFKKRVSMLQELVVFKKAGEEL